MSPPQTTKAWVLNSQNGADSLELKDGLSIPALKEDEVLVKLQGASLNHREIVIAQVRTQVNIDPSYLADWRTTSGRVWPQTRSQGPRPRL